MSTSSTKTNPPRVLERRRPEHGGPPTAAGRKDFTLETCDEGEKLSTRSSLTREPGPVRFRSLRAAARGPSRRQHTTVASRGTHVRLDRSTQQATPPRHCMVAAVAPPKKADPPKGRLS